MEEHSKRRANEAVLPSGKEQIGADLTSVKEGDSVDKE
jgi:hypothetical protein